MGSTRTTSVVATTTADVHMFVPPPRRRHVEICHKRTYRIGLTTHNIERVQVHFMGGLVDYCRYCNAKFFHNERGIPSIAREDICVAILRK